MCRSPGLLAAHLRPTAYAVGSIRSPAQTPAVDGASKYRVSAADYFGGMRVKDTQENLFF